VLTIVTRIVYIYLIATKQPVASNQEVIMNYKYVLNLIAAQKQIKIDGVSIFDHFKHETIAQYLYGDYRIDPVALGN
jgi:hypothetical protein